MPSKKLSNDGRPDDALSLHTNPDLEPEPYRDDAADDDTPDIGDLPPAYTDDLIPQPDNFVSELKPFGVSDSSNSAAYYINQRLDADPAFLERAVNRWAKTPPRPFVQLRGTHKEHKETKDNGKKRVDVVDFDIKIDLTPYLYTDPKCDRAWTSMRTVENTEKTHRGTVWRKRGAGAKQDIEVGGSAKPSLKEWCHRYCASHARLRSFRVTRTVTGLDNKLLCRSLEALVRQTNYRGHLSITFPLEQNAVEVYSDAHINHWRLTFWICWIFYFTLLFIFTWPALFFATKRYAVVIVEWPFSRMDDAGRKKYVSVSEESWLLQWNRAVFKAIMAKRQGVLDQQDLLQSHLPDPEVDTGNRAIDGAVGLLAAGVNAYAEVNRRLGWGQDR
ncbi:hypothetical protein P152DRAFT_228948 [Eremomyces bilateralis CBS 781.70]|uniref:Uncharacterized protein n=1 Tax=Eremomyces bilateralis CBS 781.70 TaxID=1392243 RepID=A0A6G1G9V6_9PEZI|nr:uncharacterized protein P152DRAFT_228948 [Eremomyces bilateralis CBS 781.70]KAF1814681.1 hypothetical protein P152DRAFT_228948 [Eremomyces bilateralis CBS 781.70]